MPAAAKKNKTQARPGNKNAQKFHPRLLPVISRMHQLGWTRSEVADGLAIRRETLWTWERDDPRVSNILKSTGLLADERVERSLYEKAVGYKQKVEKLFTWKGQVIKGECIEHVPGDTAACIFWLKNRAPDRWKDRQEIQHSHLFNFVGVVPSDEEWIEQYGSHQEPLVIDQRPKEPEEVPVDIIDKKGNGSSE